MSFVNLSAAADQIEQSSGVAILARRAFYLGHVDQIREGLTALKEAGAKVIFVPAHRDSFSDVFSVAAYVSSLITPYVVYQFGMERHSYSCVCDDHRSELNMLTPDYVWIAGDQIRFASLHNVPDGIFVITRASGQGSRFDRFHQTFDTRLAATELANSTQFPGLAYVYDSIYFSALAATRVVGEGGSVFNASLMLTHMRQTAFAGATGPVVIRGNDRFNAYVFCIKIVARSAGSYSFCLRCFTGLLPS
jgi:hypothetical protein